MGIAAAPAHAFEVAVPTAGPADPRAGQHSDVKLRIDLADGQVRDLDIHFPPGVVGNPNATDRCTLAQFEGDGCPPETKVGTSVTRATLLGLPQTLNGEIFNLQPRGNEPARLGIITDTPSGPLKLESPVFSRPTDGGLDSQLRDIPNEFMGLPITITSLETTLLGAVPSGRTFMQNPTGCGRKETVVEARSYADERAQGSGGYDSTECRALPFAPTFEAAVGAPGETAARSNPPLTTVVGQTPGQANVKSVTVTLPNDIAIGADRISRACPQDQFAAGGCPPNAQIGSATAITPLLTAPLSGPVTFVARDVLPGLVLSLRGPLSITLIGDATFTPEGLRNTFDNIPDVPLSRFELRFLGGDAGVLAASRDLCQGAPPQIAATFVSHAGTESTLRVPASVEGCTGTSTPPPQTRPAARPTASLRLGSLRRGRPSLSLRVRSTETLVKRVLLSLPRGVRVKKGTRLTGARIRSKRRRIAIPVAGRGVRAVNLTLRPGTLTVPRRLRRARRVRFGVQITESGGRRTTRRLAVTPRR